MKIKAKQPIKQILVSAASGFALLSTMCVQSVYAQSIDYSFMEELFEEPVTTSANGSPQRVSEVALNMDILTAEDIERTGARNIPEAIRFVPGVDVRQYSVGQYEIAIRGYPQPYSERILVLINGRQVYTDFFGQVIWNGLPVEMGEIKQIEIVKGPNTALFGFNAVAGVINIITYNPLYDSKKEVTVSAGSNSLSEGSATLLTKLSERVGVRLSGRTTQVKEDFSSFEDLKNSSGEDLSEAIDDTETESVTFDMWSQLTENIQTQLEITKNDSMRNEVIITRRPDSAEYDTSSIRGRVLADTAYGLVEFDAYHNEARADYDLVNAPGSVPLTIDNRITVVKLNDTVQLNDNHTLRLAGEYRAGSNIFSSTVAALDSSDLTYDIWSMSTLWDWKITDKLRTSAAVRYDYFKLEPESTFRSTNATISTYNPYSEEEYRQKREEFGYNLGITYALDASNTIRAMHARGTDLPSFTEFGFQYFRSPGDAPALGLYGNPHVDTSIVTNYEIDYDHKMPAIDGAFRSSVFYQYNDEMQAFNAVVESGAVDLGYIGNIGDSAMYGVELALEGVYKNRWDWGVNYTYVDVHDDLRNQQTASGDRSAMTSYEDSTANHILNAHLGYAADKWHADVFAQYRSAFKDVVDDDVTTNNEFNLYEAGNDVVLNANFAYDLTDRITWSVAGTSILGDTSQAVESDAEAFFWTSIKIKF